MVSYGKSKMTASKPSHLHIQRSFELRTSLKELAAEFSKQRVRLTQEIARRRREAGLRFRQGTEQIDAKGAAENSQIETEFTEAEQRILRRAETRRSRIERIEKSNNASLQDQAKRARERWLGNLQMRHFRANRDLPVNLQAEDTSLAEFLTALSREEARLATLRSRSGLGHFTAHLPAHSADGLSTDPDELLAALRAEIEAVEERFPKFGQFPMLRTLGHLRLAKTLLPQGGSSRSAAEDFAKALNRAEHTASACRASALARHESERRRLKDEYERLCEEMSDQWNQADEVEQTFVNTRRGKLDAQVPRLRQKNEAQLAASLAQIKTRRTLRWNELQRRLGAWRKQMLEEHEATSREITSEESQGIQDLAAAWHEAVEPLSAEIAAMNAMTDPVSPAWTEALVETWSPASEFPSAVRFATLDVDLQKLAGPLLDDPLFALPVSRFSIPLALRFPDQGSLLFETSEPASASVAATLNHLILRILAHTPPGRVSFTIIDPVGLGQNFAGLMHLADFEESIINRRIWTQPDQIDERLAELNEHIEKVIQMYLRNEYASITEYNAQAGSVAEKYHFLVVADFPAQFSEAAARRLQSIIASGARCGVYTLMHWDRRLMMPDGFTPDELRKNSISLRQEHGNWLLGASQGGEELTFEIPPPPALAVDLVHLIGKNSIDANRVEVPFSQIAPAPEERWTNDTTTELRIPIGRTGATKLQYLAIGKGTRQHALFAGKTGSGKSTLFHVIITNLALSCSPDQVEFYLIDFKKGVEFKCYATQRLPHARVVAIESDREFGLSVLQRVDDELKRRGDLFRQLGVQDVAGYKRAGGTEPMPRSLLLIDEFQEFFVEDDPIAQTASLLFDRIVRQGRAFGIHVLLGSQTLGGAYTLARATLGQMVIRVALQCNEADSYLIMDESNPAPRLLSRPGEGIYNDAAGALEGNSPFQVVWLSDEERDAELATIRQLANTRGFNEAAPIVFEGNSPADIRENSPLARALDGVAHPVRGVSRCWLGAPNSIKGPTEAVFRPQSGSHLLIVGQREETMQTLLGVSLLALAAQHAEARLILFHVAASDALESDFLAEAAKAVPGGVTLIGNSRVAEVMNELTAELQTRSEAGAEGTDFSPIFVFIQGLPKFKKLKPADEFDFSGAEPGPGGQFGTLLSEGGAYGIHFIVTVDTFNNASRFLSRKALSEFEMRVVFQISANDSASLIDSPQASGLGLHRALLANEQEGLMETFRPYSRPDREWLIEAEAKLASHRQIAS